MKRIPTILIAIALLSFACESKPTTAPEPQAATEEEPSGLTAENASQEAQPSEVELDLPNASEPIEGITAAAQPTQEQFENLREAGYRTVINLRTDGEPDALPDEARSALMEKVVYRQIPVSGPDDLTQENAKELHELIESRKEKGQILIHGSTSNRVGALLALRAAWFEGMEPEEALELGKKAGLSDPDLEAAVKERLAQPAQ